MNTLPFLLTCVLKSHRIRSFICGAHSRLAAALFGTQAIPFAIALVTFIVFSPALWNGFVNWDDERNLLDNPAYRGLGWQHLRWMFSTTLLYHWIPLTWVTFGLDYLLWGMNPLGYHLTSLLLHATNAAVFYLLALRLLRLATTGLEEPMLRLGAGVAALFFALHPLRAESVAWATERRDVLSGLFFLLTLLTYLKASELEGPRRRRWLAGSVVLYALALLSKSMVMSLPLVLLLLDFYPLRRFGGRWQEWTAPQARKVWAEKIPYLLLAMAAAGIALYVNYPQLTSAEKYPLPARVLVALYNLWFYARKTLFPLGLSPMYMLPPHVNLLDPPFLVSAIAVGVITVGLLLLRRRWPAGLAVWVYYGIVLAPASGIVHAGWQLANDRYSYLSCLGWALLVGAGVSAIVRSRANGALRLPWARAAAGAVAVWLVGLAVLTWQQVQIWRDADTLWRYALQAEPDCGICHVNLGVVLYNRGLTALSLEHFQRALTLRPDYAGFHDAVALTLARLGRLSEAIEHYRRVIEKYPNRANARNNLAMMLAQQGEFEEASEHFRQAIRLDPDKFELHWNLAAALTDQGNPAEAIEHYRRSIELNPNTAQPRFDLARAYLALGKTDSAQEEYEVLKRLDPSLANQLSELLPRAAKR